MLVGTTDAKVVDGVQPERVEPGRDAALASHCERRRDAEDEDSIGTVEIEMKGSVDSGGSLAPA